jgi:AraC family transcriptional regulator
MQYEKLSDGHYYGDIVKRGEIASLILTETLYPPRAVVPSHSHASAYLCVVLEGSYTETFDRKTRECDARTVAFHPPEELHAERVHARPVRSFQVEITPACMRRVRQHSDILDRPVEFRGGVMNWLGVKLYREFLRQDSVSPLAIEGLMLEIVAAGTRAQDRKLRQPASWLVRAKDLLRARFAERLSVSEIAEAVDVHPVHLAREFHKHYGCTIGEYLRKLRVDFACREMRASGRPLAEISISAGFFDQSHFSRTFKALTGMTPGEYRVARVSH